MDKPKIQRLRTSLQAALDLWAEQHDLKAHVGNASYVSTSCTFKVELAEKDAQGQVIDTNAAIFASSAHLFGLKPTDLGRTFMQAGKNFKITGLAPRSYRFPILAECQRTHKVYKFPAESIKVLLGYKLTASMVKPQLDAIAKATDSYCLMCGSDSCEC